MFRAEEAVVRRKGAVLKQSKSNRRKSKRIDVKDVIRTYCFANDKWDEVQLLNLSKDGACFRMPYALVRKWPTFLNELEVRLYISADTFVPVIFDIRTSTSSIENGEHYMLFGCAVGTLSPAYEKFFSFLKTYSENSQCDNVDVA